MRGSLVAAERLIALGAAVFLLAVAIFAPGEAGAVRPPIAKQCGAISAGGARLRVDITEVIGRGPGSCETARTVMRRFLHRDPTYPGPSGTVRFEGRSYSCYASRPDGEGWDYHCGWSSSGGSFRYIDYGAGRRF